MTFSTSTCSFLMMTWAGCGSLIVVLLIVLIALTAAGVDVWFIVRDIPH